MARSYADGIDLLYSTNTFHMSSLDLQVNLPRLVPPRHLDMITSLELLWTLNTTETKDKSWSEDHIAPFSDNRDELRGQSGALLHILCSMIPQTFPHLRNLYLSFQCWLSLASPAGWPGDDFISEVEAIFLGPVEDMLRAWARSRSGQEKHGYKDLELNVAIQRGAWFVLRTKYYKLLGRKLKSECVDMSRGRFWKPLRLDSSAAADTVDGIRAGGGEGSGNDGFGYWICGGWEDMDAYGSSDYWIMTNWGDKWTGVKETY